jgi:hypothetical protein
LRFYSDYFFAVLDHYSLADLVKHPAKMRDVLEIMNL